MKKFQVLEYFLSPLPTAELITSSRLVNKQWNSVASAVCRHRLVKFKLVSSKHSRDSLNMYCSYFNNSQNLPWSSCRFAGNEPFSSGYRNFCLSESARISMFVKMFGRFLRKLIVKEYDIQLLLDLLQWTPNLQILSFTEPLEELTEMNINRNIYKAVKDNLRNLKTLFFEISGIISFKLFDLILTHIPRLERLWLQMGSNGIVFAEQTSSLIQRIPTLSLNFQTIETPAAISYFTAKNLRPTSAALQIFSPSPPYNTEFYKPLQEFLDIVSLYLETLTIGSNRYKENTYPRLTIPSLPALKCIKIIDGPRYSNQFRVPLVLIEPFTSNQFPGLEKVEIVTLSEKFTPFNSVNFRSVREFVLHTRNSIPKFRMTNWSRIFPNLKKLKCDVSRDDLFYILNKMRKLEALDLTIMFLRYDQTQRKYELCNDGPDLNSVLTWFSDPDTVYKNNSQDSLQNFLDGSVVGPPNAACPTSILGLSGKSNTSPTVKLG